MSTITNSRYVLVSTIPGYDMQEIHCNDLHTLRVVGNSLVRKILDNERHRGALHATMWTHSEVAFIPVQFVDVTAEFDGHEYSIGGVTIYDLTGL